MSFKVDVKLSNGCLARAALPSGGSAGVYAVNDSLESRCHRCHHNHQKHLMGFSSSRKINGQESCKRHHPRELQFRRYRGSHLLEPKLGKLQISIELINQWCNLAVKYGILIALPSGSVVETGSTEEDMSASLQTIEKRMPDNGLSDSHGLLLWCQKTQVIEALFLHILFLYHSQARSDYHSQACLKMKVSFQQCYQVFSYFQQLDSKFKSVLRFYCLLSTKHK